MTGLLVEASESPPFEENSLLRGKFYMLWICARYNYDDDDLFFK